MVCWCWRENSIVVSVSGFVIGVRHLTNTTPTNKYNNYILKDLKPNINDIMCKNKSETVSEVHPDITIMRVELAINEREYGKKQIATLTVLRLQTHDRGEPHGVSRLVSCHATCEWSNGLIYCQMSTFAGLYSWEHGFQCRSFEMRTPDTMCAFVYVTYISHRIRFGSDGGTKKNLRVARAVRIRIFWVEVVCAKSIVASCGARPVCWTRNQFRMPLPSR